MPSPRWWVFPVPFVWHQYYIKDYLCARQLLDFIIDTLVFKHFSIYGYFQGCLDFVH